MHPLEEQLLTLTARITRLQSAADVSAHDALIKAIRRRAAITGLLWRRDPDRLVRFNIEHRLYLSCSGWLIPTVIDECGRWPEPHEPHARSFAVWCPGRIVAS